MKIVSVNKKLWKETLTAEELAKQMNSNLPIHTAPCPTYIAPCGYCGGGGCGNYCVCHGPTSCGDECEAYGHC